jgi:DNA-binding NarL/FixJ family response regulator
LSNPITGAITLVLADDHEILREGLCRLLATAPDIEIVEQARNGFEVLEALRRHDVDLLVTDLSMPGMPGIDLIKRVRDEHPDVHILVLSMHSEDPYAQRAFRCGANGYLTKESAFDLLIAAIRRVAGGGAYVSPRLAEHLALGLRTPSAPAHELLSNREFEVYRRIVTGQRLTDIAEELHLSIKTISTHKARIMGKLGADSTAALLRYGMEHRLFDESGMSRQALAA